jgi:hypothetical protein
VGQGKEIPQETKQLRQRVRDYEEGLEEVNIWPVQEAKRTLVRRLRKIRERSAKSGLKAYDIFKAKLITRKLRQLGGADNLPPDSGFRPDVGDETVRDSFDHAKK